MAIHWDTSEFFQNSGNVAAEFGENLRDEIVTFACDIWENYPGFVTQNRNIGSSFARGYMNSVCQNLAPAPPPPTPPFQGGQCDILYDGDFQFKISINGAPPVNQVASWQGVLGPITEIIIFDDDVCLRAVDGNPSFPLVAPGIVRIANNTNPAQNEFSLPEITSITPSPGQPPDTCGDPPAEYPGTFPDVNDLITNISLTSQDNLNVDFELQYNQLVENYNFPMGFKLNGINVTLDVSGLTIYGDTGYTTPTNTNERNDPGHDGANNGVDGPYTKEFVNQEWAVVPELPIPRLLNRAINKTICNEGVIETVSETIKDIPGTIKPIDVVVDMLTNIVEEICGIEAAEATVGLPEYYSLAPGAMRPAIVYLYKEVIDGKWSSSTYSTTVNNPSSAAIGEIPTVNVPDKTIGTIVKSLTLTDGSRIRVSGDNETNATTNFNYILSKVDPAVVPANPQDIVTTTNYPRVTVRTLKCRQIEYYSMGAGANVSPDQRRVIDLNS